MTDGLPPDAPPPHGPPPSSRLGYHLSVHAEGAPDQGALPRMETVRVTVPDLQRRAALELTRSRLVIATGGFCLLFGAVTAKLAGATILFPMRPSKAQIAPLVPPDPGPEPDKPEVLNMPHVRATITDRNGEILAISLPTAALFANPREMIDPAEAAHRLKSVLPRLDEDLARARLTSGKQFVYLERQITPPEEIAINDLGIPGIYFQPGEKRRYPLGRVAAQVLGGVDVDSHGVAGVERYFEKRLRNQTDPLRLSIDVRVQAVMREELDKAKTEFQAIGACGIVMDVRTGEVLAMVSLPDYDANEFGSTPPDDRFNRAVTGMYEPGSTFKLQTAAMALDDGTAHIWDQFDAAHPIHIGRFTITDYKGKNRFLYLPEVLAYSSNLGAARLALTAGAERQRAWLRTLGMFSRVGVQLPEAGLPIIPPASNWKDPTVMTVGFGHGIAISPLHVVRGTAVLTNGGHMLAPTVLAVDPAEPPPPGPAVMAPSTSNVIRKLMRLVVTNGYGKAADVEGYFVGGKTGTAEKVGAHGYKKHTNISAFMSVFPMNAPRYAVYFMLDEPHGDASTGGYSTAGKVSAPGAGRVIARIAPMLGLFPQIKNLDEIQASLAIPLQPGRGSGEPTGNPEAIRAFAALPPAAEEEGTPAPGRAGRHHTAALRHEAALKVPADDAE
jgi:cell division protein FtsI (penicillin-binding protein 3)